MLGDGTKRPKTKPKSNEVVPQASSPLNAIGINPSQVEEKGNMYDSQYVPRLTAQSTPTDGFHDGLMQQNDSLAGI